MGSHNRTTMKRFAIIAAMAMVAVGGPWAPTAWGQCAANELAKLTASDAATGDFFGVSVSVSGEAAVIGAPLDDDGGVWSGSAYVYRFDGTKWNEEAKLTASDAAAGDQFGRAVSISGNVAVIGAWSDGDACPDDPWCRSGSAYVFRFDRQTSRWDEEAKLTASDAEEGDWFGWSVSSSGDVALIGAHNNDDAGTLSGSAYVYQFNQTTGQWVEQAKLTAFDADVWDQFGYSVSIGGEVAVIGALNEGSSGGPNPFDGPGAAYVYRFDPAGPGQWVHEGKLTASDGEAGNRFTESVSISGGAILIGATADDDNGVYSGSAYVYRFDPDGLGQWVQEQKLTASDGATDDDFGMSVSISGDVALIGAEHFFNGSPGAAYVYRFKRTTGQWVEEAKLRASDGTTTDFFGSSVSISTDLGLIGAVRDDGPGADSGSAYLFRGLADCNDNGALDLCDIADETSSDANANGIPDECEPPDCPADLDGDGGVGILDLLALLTAWGSNPGGPPDFDGDGSVGILDLLTLLANWGPCP